MHIPVLLKEILDVFDPRPGQIYIDATINGGGHAQAILRKIGPKGKLLGIDWDCDLIAKLKAKSAKENLILNCDNYADIKSIARKYHLDKINGILFDLGFSSYHIEKSGRGFSFLKHEPLDMRYNSHENSLTAYQIINTWPQKAIEDVLHNFGEERFARRISTGIIRARSLKRVSTADELAGIIEQSIPYRFRRSRIHSATRTFQALRIAVNRELENCAKALQDSIQLLEPQGKIAVISFHSLEDRIVKNFFKEKEREGIINILTKKSIVASKKEVAGNPRARSAKLRVAIKI